MNSNSPEIKSHSSVELPTHDYLRFQEEIKLVKYPVQAISAAQDLTVKMESFKNKKQQEELEKAMEGLNSYRQVRGDGNCFFRAVGFAYIASKESTSIEQCFTMLREVSLTGCFEKSIPRDFKKFYDDQFLKSMLEFNWELAYEEQLKANNHLYMKALLKVINKFPFLDFIIVLYFRALCLRALARYQSQVKDFLDGTEQDSIRKYSEESEGIILELCSRMLSISTHVYQIRKESVSKYVYESRDSNADIHLLFYQNHYDIIEINTNIESEKSVIGKDEDYFSEVNDKQIEGVCIECGAKGQIYEESGLCTKCYTVSMNSFQNFKKEKFTISKCTQCLKMKKDVSEVYGLCKDCIEIQNKFTKKKEETKKFEKGVCVECGFQEQIYVDLQLCKVCKDYQEKKTVQMAKSKQIDGQAEKDKKKENEEKSEIREAKENRSSSQKQQQKQGENKEVKIQKNQEQQKQKIEKVKSQEKQEQQLPKSQIEIQKKEVPSKKLKEEEKFLEVKIQEANEEIERVKSGKSEEKTDIKADKDQEEMTKEDKDKQEIAQEQEIVKEEKVHEHKVKEEKVQEEKVKEEKAKEEKVQEEKVLEEQAKQDKIKQEKTKQQELKEQKAKQQKLKSEKARQQRERQQKIKEEQAQEEKLRQQKMKSTLSNEAKEKQLQSTKSILKKNVVEAKRQDTIKCRNCSKQFQARVQNIIRNICPYCGAKIEQEGSGRCQGCGKAQSGRYCGGCMSVRCLRCNRERKVNIYQLCVDCR